MRHFIKYTLAVVIIVAIIVTIVHFARTDYKNYTNEEIETEMLQIRAKARLEFEKYHIDNENGLIGEKIVNQEYGIEEEGNFFKWTKEILEKLGLTQNLLKDDEYYIVNYDTEDVIFSSGIKYKDGNIYYRLSELEKAKEESNKANETANEIVNNVVNDVIENVIEGEQNDGERNTET